jgi:hypothetical protein
MKTTLHALVANLDRGFYADVHRAQKDRPDLTAAGHLLALARAAGVEPPAPVIDAEEREIRRVGTASERCWNAPLLRSLLEQHWVLEASFRAAGVDVRDPSATLGKLFESGQSTVLFPAWVELMAVSGIFETSLVPVLVSQELPVTSHLAQHVRLTDGPADRRASASAEGARSSVVRLRTTDASIRLHKHQVELHASYEALRLQRLPTVALFLKRLGHQLAVDETDDLLDVALGGDGNAGSPNTPLPVAVSGTLAYPDLLKLTLAFREGYRMRAAVVNPTHLQALLTLAEFKDVLAGFNFQATGIVPDFLGAVWFRWASTGSTHFQDRLLALDPALALIQYTEQPLLTETDRLIDRQFERTVLSKWTGFGKVDYDATQALNTAP